MRRALTWLVALPVIVVGSQVAHGIAYWWAYPQADLRLAALHHSGHGYQAYAPIVLGFLAGIELVALGAAVLDAARNRPARALPASAFVFIPLLGFVFQEYLERFLIAGVFPSWTLNEPSFWRGAVLQVPVGLIACLIVRLLLRSATAVARIVGSGRETHRGRPRPATMRRPHVFTLPRLTPLARAAAGRAPPLLAR